MPYVDGFVLPVPTDNLAAYRRMAARQARYGASTARSNTSNASPMTSSPASTRRSRRA